MDNSVITYSGSKLSNLNKIAENILDIVTPLAKKSHVIIYLNGDLGAGKTTLMQHIAKKLEVSEKIVSPTFILKKIYKLNKPLKSLIHIDAYRLTSKREAKALKIENYFEKGNLIFIEWPTLSYVENPSVTVSIDHVDPETRNVTITTHVKKL